MTAGVQNMVQYASLTSAFLVRYGCQGTERAFCKRVWAAFWRLCLTVAPVHAPYVRSFRRCLSLQIPWVIVPIGQKAHQVLGLYKAMTSSPINVDVSIRL